MFTRISARAVAFVLALFGLCVMSSAEAFLGIPEINFTMYEAWARTLFYAGPEKQQDQVRQVVLVDAINYQWAAEAYYLPSWKKLSKDEYFWKQQQLRLRYMECARVSNGGKLVPHQLHFEAMKAEVLKHLKTTSLGECEPNPK